MSSSSFTSSPSFFSKEEAGAEGAEGAEGADGAEEAEEGGVK